MSTFFRTQMTGRRGNPLVLRKILPNPDLVIASTGADIGFYIVSLVGQVIVYSDWESWWYEYWDDDDDYDANLYFDENGKVYDWTLYYD